MTDRRLLTVRDVASALGIGRTYVYDLINRGELHAIKLGRLTRVTPEELDRFVAEKVRQVEDFGLL